MKTMAAHGLPGWPHFSVEVETEQIEVRQMTPTRLPDPDWRYTDKRGHGHFWKLYSKTQWDIPTCAEVVTGTEWVGDEYDGDEVEITEWQCHVCGETIEPGYRLDYGPTHIPGMTWVTVEINGETFRLSPEQYAQSVDAWRLAIKETYE